MIRLSKRLQAVAELVTSTGRICDVGTDHGYIPIYLVQNHRIESALAMDVNEGPLERARDHIAKEGTDNYIVTRRSDGLVQMQPGEAESIVIAGMGGGLMMRILDESIKKLEAVKELILQPQSDVEQVRRYVRTHGFVIMKEDMVLEDGKYYMMFRCEHAKDENEQSSENPVYDRYGRYLIAGDHPVLSEYLDKEEKQLRTILNNLEKQSDSLSAAKRRQEIEDKLFVINMARKEMESGCSVRI